MSKEGQKVKSRKPATSTPLIQIVTGMSGAGKSSALKALEDFGYEAVDNLPLSMLMSLVRPTTDATRPLAIGIDSRTRDFGVSEFMNELDDLIHQEGRNVRVLFLDSSDEVLRRRYTETRHRHPLAADRPVTDGIRIEREMVSPLMERADLVIDTSDLGLHDLKRVLAGHFATDTINQLSVFVMSFSYRQGLPPEADIVFDVRFLANPHYEPDLRELTGRDASVGAFIENDPAFKPFFESLTAMLHALLPRYSDEGKSYLTIALGCTGGKHRSVYVSERLADWLREKGSTVGVSHREIPEVVDS